jgi:hypothetical protein
MLRPDQQVDSQQLRVESNLSEGLCIRVARLDRFADRGDLSAF